MPTREALTNEERLKAERERFDSITKYMSEFVFPQETNIGDGTLTTCGLSKRELFAAMMAQAILTGAVTRACPAHEWLDQSMAVKCADALLAALKETP